MAPPIWLDQLDPKEPYVDLPDSTPAFYFDWGSAYGRAMAEGEDRALVEAIAEAPGVHHDSGTSTGDVARLVEAKVKEMLGRGMELTIIVVGGADGIHSLRKVPGFSFTSGEHGQLGRLGEADAFHLRGGSMTGVFVADFRRLGRWRQYPAPVQEGGAVLEGILSVSVQAFDEDSARQFMRSQPKLFDDATPPLSDDEKLRELQKRVRLRVSERFEYCVEDPRAAAIVELKLDEPGE